MSSVGAVRVRGARGGFGGVLAGLAAAAGMLVAVMAPQAAAAAGVPQRVLLPEAAPRLGPIRPRYAAILVDADSGEVLYQNAADELRHPASITKVMTLYLTFEALASGRLRLGDRITFSAHAVAQKPSKLGLAVGESISVDDAIRVIAVKSANDCAVALAERLAGSEQAFAQMMTRKARALGMRNTVFSNASGLTDPDNVTTARDLSILARAVLRNHPTYYPYFSTRSLTWGKAVFVNHNHLLGKTPGMDGFKTGFTNDAGFTLLSSAKRNGRRLITAVLGEPNIPSRNRDTTALLDAGFAVLDRRATGERTTVAANLPNLNHPALRIARETEQGSSDDAAPRARRTRATHAAKATRLAERRHGRGVRETRLAARAGKGKSATADRVATGAKGRKGIRTADKGSARRAKRS